MTPGNGQPVRYEITLLAQTRTILKHLHLQAVQRGEGHQFLSALRQIIARLRTDARDFGEPLYHLPVMGLLVRQAMVSPLVVDYAVHETEPLVFIRGFKALS